MGLCQETFIRSQVVTQWTLYGSISGYADYKELFKALQEAQEGDIIELRINCSGGDCSVGTMIIQAMKETRAIVICNVVYPSYSMGSLIAISGDFLVMQKNAFLMFHTYSCMTGGKSPDLIKDVKFMDVALKGMSDEVSSPFLTKSEITRINNGEDFYITADDPTLAARIKRHFKGVESV